MDIKDANGKTIATVTAADPDVIECDEGVWVELKADDGSKPTLCFVKEKGGAVYLGVYRDAANPGAGCDVGLRLNDVTGPSLQVVRGYEVKVVDLFELIGLLERLGDAPAASQPRG